MKDEGPPESGRRPDIVFIIADDLGWGDVGYHGAKIRTPNLDRLAAGAVRFERQYVAPTCTPTRVGLLSGRYPSRYGVVSPAYGKIFDADTVTLATALRDAGYLTSISGKWHMGSPPDWVPRRHGFVTSYGYFHGQIDPYTHLYKTGVRSWHRNDQYLEETGHATDLITDEAVRIIESEAKQPLFLYVAYSVPHFPLDDPEQWTSMYEGVFEEESRRWYAASVSHMDQGIGRIAEALERTGRRPNTVFVFVSDNGGQQSWHSDNQYKGRYANKPHKVLGDNRPWRGWKGQVYEGGIRVPAFVSWPGRLEPKKVASAVHIVDWMPTLCRLAEAKVAGDMKWDGRDIWPLVSGQLDALEPRPLYWKTPKAYAVLHGDWKLIVGKDRKRAELYDLGKDPHEAHDLAKSETERVAQLRAVLAQIAAGDK